MNVQQFKKKPPRAKRCQASDGTWCDSVTERDLYHAFQRMEIPFQFQVEKMLVGPAVHRALPKHRQSLPLLRDRGAEAITMTIDFVFEKDGIEFFVDSKGSKGHVKRDSKLRYDMLKHQLINAEKAHCTRIIFISTLEVNRLAQYAAYEPKNFWIMFDQLKER